MVVWVLGLRWGLSLSGGWRDVSNCRERRAIDAASSIDGIRTRLRAALLHRRRAAGDPGHTLACVLFAAPLSPGVAPPPPPRPKPSIHHHHHCYYPGSITSSQGGLQEEDKPSHRVCRALFALGLCFFGLCKVCKSLRHTFMSRCFMFFFGFLLRWKPNYKHAEV